MAALLGVLGKVTDSFFDKGISVDNWTFKAFYKVRITDIFPSSNIWICR